MAGLKERVLQNLKRRRERIINGHINSIPSPFVRFRDDFLGIEQGKFYIVTGFTKSSKTQLGSYLFIYNTLLYAYNNPDKLKLKIFYYPLEETPEDILTRFMSYLLYVQSGFKIRIEPTDLSSTRNDKVLDEAILELLGKEEYDKIISFFEESVIFSASTNPTGVFNECRKYAEEHGTVYKKKQKIKDEFGVDREIDVFDYYEPEDPNEYRIIFIDHISLVSTERGMTLKQSIDKLSEYCVLLRNRYKYTPVVIQQQTMSGEDLDAFKANKLRPTLANLGDSKVTARDANVILGLFSPIRHELPEYLGYDITKLKDNVRFLEVMINRSGSAGGIVALYFDGAVNYFRELPNAKTQKEELEKVYRSLNKLGGTIFTLISYSKKLYDTITNRKK